MKDARDLSPKETVEALRCCGTPDKCHECSLYVPDMYDLCYDSLMLHAADVLEELILEYDSMAKTVCEMSEYYRDRRRT